MMNAPTRQLSEHLAATSTTSRRPRRKKTVSSLQGMFLDDDKSDDLKSVDSFDSIEKMKYSAAERDSLRLMSWKLRQAKRKLLLKCVEAPADPVDKLRDMLLKLSVDSSDEFSTSVNPLSITAD